VRNARWNPELAAIVDERLEDGFGGREINQRRSELDGDEFPESEEKRGGGEEARAMPEPGRRLG